MKAMVLTALRDMEMRDVPTPKIENDTDVLLRVGVVGVCGSDVHYYLRGRIGRYVVEYPFAVGHETACVVEKVGSAVTRVKPGDKVAIDPAMPCGECDQCRCGRENTCRNLRFLGCPGEAEGSLGEFLVMPEGSCFALKETTSLEAGSIIEPLSIGVYAVEKSVPMQGAAIGILGNGPIGLSVLLAARAAGAERIYATDRIDARLEAAKKAGATWTGNPEAQDVVAGIMDVEPAQLDAVFECCGQEDAMDQAGRLLKPGGKMMILGIPETSHVSFDLDNLRRHEITIYNVRRQNKCVQAAIDLVESGKVDADALVTHRYGFEQTRDAFELVAEYADGVVKAVITV